MYFENDSHHRFVNYTKDAEGDVNTLGTQYKCLKEVLIAINWFLSNYAHKGEQVKESQPLYLYQTKKRAYAPSFDVLYTYDERDVRIHNILLTLKEDDLSE